MQSDLTLVALQTLFLTDLQKEGAVSEGETAVHTLSAPDTFFMIDDVLKIGGFYFMAGKRIDRTELIFRSFIPGEGLRIKKAGAKITISAHGKIVKTLDCRHYFVASVGAHAATDTFFGIDLPNEHAACDFFLCSEKADGTEQTCRDTVSATCF